MTLHFPGPASHRFFLALLTTMLVAVSSVHALQVPSPDQLRQLRDAGEIDALEDILSQVHSAYRAGSIDDDTENETIKAVVSTDPRYLAFYEKWASSYPESYMAQVVLGHVHAQTGFARRGSDTFAATPPDRIKAMTALHQKARISFEHSMRLTSKPISALAGLIRIARTTGSQDEISLLLRKAIALDPACFRPRISALFSHSPSWGGSLKLMEAVLADAKGKVSDINWRRMNVIVEDERREPEFHAALRLVDEQKYREAIVELTDLLEKTPYVRGYIRRGDAFVELKRWNSARDDFKKALDMDPDGFCCRHVLASLARAQLETGQVQEGMANLIQAAGGDHEWAINTLAVVYAFGRYGQKQDLVQARRWCARSADLGNPLAMYCMGSLYHAGQGGPKDPQKALYWLSKAADANIDDARADLAFILWNGMGVPADKERALALWTASAKRGHARSQSQLRPKLGSWDYFWQVEQAELISSLFPKNQNAWWVPVAKGLVFVIVMSALGVLLAKLRRRADRATPAGVLRHTGALLTIGVVCSLLFFGGAGASVLFAKGSELWVAVAIFLLLGALSALVIIEYFRIHHEYGSNGMRYSRLFGSKQALTWQEVISLRYRPNLRWLEIKTRTGKTARVSIMMAGLPGFAMTVLRHVPPAAIEPATQNLLFAMMRGRVPSGLT